MARNASSADAPRGIRNHNPGNIVRTLDRWQGMSPMQPDAKFVTFTAPVWGIRAMARVIRTYIADGSNTVREIITRWAPPSENITSAYVQAVSASIGLNPDDRVPLGGTNDKLIPLLKAIVQHENGRQPYPHDTYVAAIHLERSTRG